MGDFSTWIIEGNMTLVILRDIVLQQHESTNVSFPQLHLSILICFECANVYLTLKKFCTHEIKENNQM